MKKNKEYKFAIIIPSYNEARNIRILIKEIHYLFPNFKIFIIDDSSKEENLKIKRYIKKYTNVTLFSRSKKSGRGSAVMLGLKKAFVNKRIKYFIEMDSDLAHNPNEILRFIKKIKIDQYGLIIGSRYLPGGKIKNITMNRTLLSRFINKFLKIWLGISVTDFTSGFRLYSRECVAYLIKQNIKSSGFITLSESLYKINKKDFLIGEVPITWNYRIYGKSNVNFQELIISLFYVIKLRLSR